MSDPIRKRTLIERVDELSWLQIFIICLVMLIPTILFTFIY